MIENMYRNLLHSVSVFTLFGLVAAAAYGEQFEAFTEPYRRVAIPAPEIGVIAEILVEEGNEVSQQQVLARLDDEVLRASLEVAAAAKDAKGALRTAEIDLETRLNQLESYRELRERGNATQRELDRAESEYHQSAARLQTVREDLEVRRLEHQRVQAQVKQRMIESPIDGFVVAIDKEVGEFVSPTDPVVMHVVHLKTLKAVFSVPIDAASVLRPGQEVRLSIGYDATPAGGVIEFVSPVADPESSTVRVKVRISNRQGKIRSGVACRWNLEVRTPPEKTSRKNRLGTTLR